ncbi:1842_t:CDS:2 [Dentiscutata heterogama]|uniref:1842_t:CDS:1 n=1 Tax=Dentiscutata heterogama TaxID=1316150 RepID=A0ACA9L7Q0_9GLOM|nr:1842_t:CDS:2 [Dentiscutata heterogama]
MEKLKTKIMEQQNEISLIRNELEKYKYGVITEVSICSNEMKNSSDNCCSNDVSTEDNKEIAGCYVFQEMIKEMGDKDFNPEQIWEFINNRLEYIFGHNKKLKDPGEQDKNKYLSLINYLQDWNDRLHMNFPVIVWKKKAEDSFESPRVPYNSSISRSCCA